MSGNGNGNAARSSPRRTSRPTRRCAGARAAATTRSSRRCSRSCRSSASRARTSSSSRGSAARRASRTTWRRTGCTRSTAARRRSRPGSRVSRPDLSVWVVTGDGDALSIGGNHLIHALRRNVNLKILLFNNQIYGLTKGQYSPTSQLGKVTKSTPLGSLDRPFNPISLAIGAEATFVARSIDTDRAHLTEVLRAAAQPSRRRVRRDLPELQHLQRRRVRLRPRGQDEPDLPRARPADPLRRERREGRAAAAGRVGRGVRGRGRAARARRAPWSSRRSRSRCRA